MNTLVQETPNIAFNVARYWLAWFTAFENYRHDFESAYMTAARTAFAGYPGKSNKHAGCLESVSS